MTAQCHRHEAIAKLVSMAEVRGRFVFDDNLTPGRKTSGGWSQNLYDAGGHMETHADFIPDDDEPESYERSVDKSGLSDEDHRMALEAGLVIAAALVVASPHVKQWWELSAWPRVKNLLANGRQELRELKWVRRSPITSETCAPEGQRPKLMADEVREPGPEELPDPVERPIPLGSSKSANLRQLQAGPSDAPETSSAGASDGD